MLLRLDDKPRTFDFRPGKTGWGHNMHAGTFRAVEGRWRWRGWLRWPAKVPRVSVMVHCQGPRLGDTVIYQAQSGVIRTCEIVDIGCCRDPHDMFTLTLEEKATPPNPSPNHEG